MKRSVLVVLAGTSLLIPIDAEAQRNRARHAPSTRVVQAPVSARLANCRAPRGARAYTCRNDARHNVVYSYGARRNRVARAWVPARWGRIHMYRLGRRAMRGQLHQADLRQILGRATVRRARELGRRQGLRGALRGHWLDSRRFGAVLTLTMGGHDIVELVDFNRDGIVDEVLVRNGRRW